MAVVDGLTAAKTLELTNAAVVSGVIDADGELILTTQAGATINAGAVHRQVYLSLEDLNTIVSPANYVQISSANATLVRNYPVALAGHLEVLSTNMASPFVVQRYTEYDTPSPVMWVRTYYNGSWGSWEASIDTSYMDAKGDLIVGTGLDTATRLPVGSNGQVLTADSTLPAGVKWAPSVASGGGSANLTRVAVSQWVTSPFIRTNNNRALGSNTSNKMFIPVPSGGTFDQCAINVTTGVAGATAQVVLYADDGTGRPSGSVLATSPAIDCATAGNKTATFSSAVVVASPGVWADVTFSDTTVAISWAEVTGPRAGLNTVVGRLFSTTSLNVPENADTALFYWVPRVALRRSA